MLKKTEQWSFSEDCKSVFEKLKKAFISASILAFFDLKKKTVLETDTSN